MANGLLDIFGSALGTTPPSYMEGLLGAQQTEDLRKRSIGSGLVNALVGYAAMPKNQNLGLGRILAGTAQAGIKGAQSVYDTAMQDYQTQAKIAEMKRQQEQQMSARDAVDKLLQDPKVANDPMAVAFIKSNPMEALKLYATPRERKTATVNNQVIDTATGDVIFTGEKELKAPPTRMKPQGRSEIMQELQPDGTWLDVGTKSLDAPKEPKALYAATPVETASGYVYMPTAEGASKGMPALDAATGKPVAGVISNKQLEARKAEEAKIAGKQSTLDQIQYVDAAIGSVKEILNDPLTFTAGLVGRAATAAGTPSNVALETAIKTIKANLSFDALKDIKASGATLGSISAPELELLGASVAGLNPNMSKADLLKNLKEIESRYNKIKVAAQKDLKPKDRTFVIDGQNIPARLSADGNYYAVINGKVQMVKE
jgi:hypothetical protein